MRRTSRTSSFLLAGVLLLGTLVERTANATPGDAIDRCAAAAEEAQRLRNVNRLREAREQLLICSNDECPLLVKRDCSKWAQELDEAMPRVVVRVVDARKREVRDVKVWIDGRLLVERLDGTPLTVDPGPHLFRFEVASGDVKEEETVLRPGEVHRWSISFAHDLRVDGTRDDGSPDKKGTTSPTTPTPTNDGSSGSGGGGGSRAVGYIAGGVALAGIGTFVLFEALWRNDYSDLESGCGKTRSCSDSEVDPVRTKLVVARVGLVVGVVALGVAVWQLVIAPPKAPAPTVMSRGLTF